MTLQREHEQGEGKREERDKEGKVHGTLYFSQYLVGWLKTVAMLDPVKLSELARQAQMAELTLPLLPAWGPGVMKVTQRKVGGLVWERG